MDTQIVGNINMIQAKVCRDELETRLERIIKRQAEAGADRSFDSKRHGAILAELIGGILADACGNPNLEIELPGGKNTTADMGKVFAALLAGLPGVIMQGSTLQKFATSKGIYPPLAGDAAKAAKIASEVDAAISNLG